MLLKAEVFAGWDILIKDGYHVEIKRLLKIRDQRTPKNPFTHWNSPHSR